jgi:hypothetical protein
MGRALSGLKLSFPCDYHVYPNSARVSTSGHCVRIFRVGGGVVFGPLSTRRPCLVGKVTIACFLPQGAASESLYMGVRVRGGQADGSLLAGW